MERVKKFYCSQPLSLSAGPADNAKGEYDRKVHSVINRFFPKLNVFKRL
jgi:hypothetical protein